MIRRKFLALLTVAGAEGLARLSPASAAGKQSLSYQVIGFTCPTCAVGLETLLHREPGILTVSAAYPSGIVLITFNPRSISEESILAAIASMGFHAQAAAPVAPRG